MHDFVYKGSELYCEDVKVSTIAKAVGTPFYLYSHKSLSDHFLKLKQAFKEIEPLICFSMKSNSSLAVVKLLSNLGSGFDVVSVGELIKALKIKANPKKIVYASVGKTDEEIAFAIKTGILLFNIESLPELEAINIIAIKLGRKVQATLRINPDVDAATFKAVTTGTLKNKFGVDLTTARRIFNNQKQYSNVKLNGIHMHIGSQIIKSTPYINAVKKAIKFLEVLKQDGHDVDYLDIGGGLGIIYKNERPQTADEFAKVVLPYLARTGKKIILEPGRFIVGNSGIFVTKVLYLKDNGVKKFLIVDGGMNDLIRPSLYDAYHDIAPVKKEGRSKITVDVVGPICESGDYFAKDREVQLMKKGELLAVMSAGAYGYTMSSNYNSRRRVPEVLVKGNKFAVVKTRETFEDMMRGETIPNFIK